MATRTFIAKQVFLRNSFVPACIVIKDGKIRRIVDSRDELTEEEKKTVVEVEDECLVLPGLVDSHVHVNEPGRTHWEGFTTATRTAAAAGVTCLADMPLNSLPPTTSFENLQVKLAAAKGQCWVDVAFLGGVIHGNRKELPDLLRGGVRGCKAFLLPSGVPEFPPVTLEEAKEALEEMKGAVPLYFHAEMELGFPEGPGDPHEYSTFLASRPPEMEETAIAGVVQLSRSSGRRCHVVHLSAASAVPLLREAKGEGVPVSVETCPHYLSFHAETIPRAQPRFKCCPPIRSQDNCNALWEALREGVIDIVVSDHSPCPKEMKETGGGDYLRAWGGIPSLQWTLPMMHSEGVIQRGFSWERVVECVCSGPARLLGLETVKGRIEEGYDGDLVIFHPARPSRVEVACLEHKNKLSPWEGWEWAGRVEMTVVRGYVVFDRSRTDRFDGPHGQFMLKEQ